MTFKELNEQFEKVTKYFHHDLDYTKKDIKGTWYVNEKTDIEWNAYKLCALTNGVINE